MYTYSSCQMTGSQNKHYIYIYVLASYAEITNLEALIV